MCVPVLPLWSGFPTSYKKRSDTFQRAASYSSATACSTCVWAPLFLRSSPTRRHSFCGVTFDKLCAHDARPGGCWVQWATHVEHHAFSHAVRLLSWSDSEEQSQPNTRGHIPLFITHSQSGLRWHRGPERACAKSTS